MAVIGLRLFEKGLVAYLNVSRDDGFFTWSGRLFHSVVPAIEKEQSPNFVENRGTSRRFFNEDRSLLSAATLMKKSEMQSEVRHTTIIQCFIRDQAQLISGPLGNTQPIYMYDVVRVYCHAADRLYDQMVSIMLLQ